MLIELSRFATISNTDGSSNLSTAMLPAETVNALIVIVIVTVIVIAIVIVIVV